MKLRRNRFEVGVLTKLSFFIIIKSLDFGLQELFRGTKWTFFGYEIISIGCF